jgi:hypothetical protein
MLDHEMNLIFHFGFTVVNNSPQNTHKNMKLEQKIAIVCKYHGPTDSNGARVSLACPLLGKRKVIPYNYSLNNSHEVAHAWLSSHGIKCEAFVSLSLGETIVCDWSQLPALEAIFKK